MYGITESEQMPKRRMEFAPSWLATCAEKVDLTNNWKSAHECVSEESVDSSENDIGSHFV